MIIRKANLNDVKGIATVHVESWRTTYKGIMPQPYLDGLNVEQREQIWINNLNNADQDIFVAENDQGEIIGFTSAGQRDTTTEENTTDLTTLYLLEPYHGQGIGKALLKAVVEAIQARGFTKINVEVIHENKTRLFYEKFGAQYVKTVKISVYRQPIDEDIYIWTDLNTLLQKLN
jgi:ribosomal protein S18 acetylase RimI-like enzyme